MCHLLFSALLLLPAAQPDAAEQKALAVIKDHNGTFIRDLAMPGQPMVTVKFRAGWYSQADLKALAGLPHLRELHFDCCWLEKDNPQPLAGLTKLEVLNL